MTDEPAYASDPVSFTTMDEAHVLIKALDDTLERTDMGKTNLRGDVVELLSEVVFNAVLHGMTEEDAHAHVRHMPERMGWALDCVVADRTLASGPPRPRTGPGKVQQRFPDGARQQGGEIKTPNPGHSPGDIRRRSADGNISVLWQPVN